MAENGDANAPRPSIHREYLEEHPELRELMSEFTAECLRTRPANVFEYAESFFAGIAARKMATRRPVVICGPSGVGKGTLIKRIMDAFPSAFGFSVSHTTRDPRPGEADGVHYNFSSVDVMKGEIADKQFIEHAEVHGNFYGTSRRAVDSVAGQGRICILDIDVQGVRQVKESSLDALYLFIAPPKALEDRDESLRLLEERLRGRGTETEDKIQKRMHNAQGEMEFGLEAGAVNKVLVNDDLDETTETLKALFLEWYPHLALMS